MSASERSLKSKVRLASQQHINVVTFYLTTRREYLLRIDDVDGVLLNLEE